MIAEEWKGSDEPERWSAALTHVPHSYWHGARPCHAASVNSGFAVYLHVLRDANSTLACPVMERPWRGSLDYTTPIGFSGLAASGHIGPDGFLDQWSKAMTMRGANSVYLAQHPLFGPDLSAAESSAGSSLFLLDLSIPLEDWLARIDQNRRRSIRAWQRQGDPWILDRAGLTTFLLENHALAMRAVNASAGSYFTDEALRLLCTDPDVALVGAADEEGICSAAAFGASRWGAELLFHVSIRAGRVSTAALIWWAVQHYHGKVPILNLGGTPAENDALADAKRRYRPTEIPLRKLKLILDPATYRRLCSEATLSPHAGSGYFPAYRQPGSSAGGPTDPFPITAAGKEKQ